MYNLRTVHIPSTAASCSPCNHQIKSHKSILTWSARSPVWHSLGSSLLLPKPSSAEHSFVAYCRMVVAFPWAWPTIGKYMRSPTESKWHSRSRWVKVWNSCMLAQKKTWFTRGRTGGSASSISESRDRKTWLDCIKQSLPPGSPLTPDRNMRRDHIAHAHIPTIRGTGASKYSWNRSGRTGTNMPDIITGWVVYKEKRALKK